MYATPTTQICVEIHGQHQFEEFRTYLTVALVT